MTIITNHRKKGKTYTAVIRKGPYRTKPLTKTHDTIGQAKAWKAEQEKLISMKKHRDPRLADHVTLQKALEKYAKHGKSVLKKSSTTLDREQYSQRHLETIIGKNTPLSEITPAVVSHYQTTRIEAGASSSSIRQELAMLSRMFRIAKTTWMLPVDNPVDSIDRIKPDKGRIRFLSDQEAAIVIQETKNSRNERFYPFALLLMHTGMRSGEAARLTEADVDLKSRILTIYETKTNTPRTIGISNDVAAALKSIDPYKDGFFFLQPNHRASKHIMFRPGCVFRECWKRLWQRLEKKHNEDPSFPKIENFKPHDLRHTAASHLLRQGIDIRIIADILGHSTLQMVMRYTHLFDSSKIKYADSIAYLGKPKGGKDDTESDS